ncbi:hypothetical protein G9P44_006012 [Scheffersomyces stipitis]|nr:hypothetical protein G9P44_006012 [Scheffersomyces stipitis]
MSRIVIFGAHGKVGQQLVKLIASRSSPYRATAVVRNQEQANHIQEIAQKSSNISTKLFTVDSASIGDLVEVIVGHDAVVFTAGSGGKNLLQVDLDGAVKTFEASVIAEVRRFIIVSAIYADSREFFEKSPIRNYYIAKHYADRILEAEFKDELDYTILRPSLLKDDPPQGKIKVLSEGDESGSVTRADVARVIFEIIDNKVTFGRGYDFNNGDSDITDPETFK